MREAAPKQTETRIRTILGCFLFQGDDVFKKVSVLSGGEKSRLALARMLLSPANFLIFDEPTNHLDMQSKDILQQALKQYAGTFIIVSHDVDFLDPIVNKVLEVQPDDTTTYLGNVSRYLEKKEKEEETNSVPITAENNEGTLSRKDERRIEAKNRQARSEKINPLKRKINSLEKKIETLEAQKTELEQLMADPGFYDDSDKVKETTLKYNKLKGELVEVYSKWEKLVQKIEEVEYTYS